MLPCKTYNLIFFSASHVQYTVLTDTINQNEWTGKLYNQLINFLLKATETQKDYASLLHSLNACSNWAWIRPNTEQGTQTLFSIYIERPQQLESRTTCCFQENTGRKLELGAEVDSILGSAIWLTGGTISV